jgi:hypothetical protein
VAAVGASAPTVTALFRHEVELAKIEATGPSYCAQAIGLRAGA